MTSLARSEADRLTSLEAVVERGLKTFVEVGEALLEIQTRALFRAEHASFDDYLRDRWGVSRGQARRTIVAAEVAKSLPIGMRPKTESQARELLPLRDRPDKMAAAMRDASRDGPPTAAKIRESVRGRRPAAEPKPGPPAELPSRSLDDRVMAACAFIRRSAAELDVDSDPERWLRQLVGTRLAIDGLIERVQAARGVPAQSSAELEQERGLAARAELEVRG